MKPNIKIFDSMKRTLFTVAFIIASLLASWTMTATEPKKIEDSVIAIAEEFENIEGISGLVIKKGEGLGLIKAMFNKEFGKEFMKGVTSMVIIDYSSATEEAARSLRSRFDSFKGVLQEIESEEGDLEEGEYIRILATYDEKEDSVSDLILNIEDKESRMVMYMGGKLTLEDFDLL